MKPEFAARLAAVPPLDRRNAAASGIPCKVCGAPALFFDVVDFNKCVGTYAFGPAGVAVPWHRCRDCGFLFTPFFDDWTNADFARFIYNADYKLLDPDYVRTRPLGTAETFARLLHDFRDLRILDYGAGAGVFATRMRELGYPHIESYDPFSIPQRPVGTFDLVVCVEVIEHSPTPRPFLDDMLSFLVPDGCIVLGESLQPADIDQVRGNWWYVAPRNGHVSTFADRTLALLAGQRDLVFHRGAGHPHVLCRPAPGRFSDMAARFGPALACYQLGAPGRWPAVGLHGVEGPPGEQFQWTASEVIAWRVQLQAGPPRLLQIMVPFIHQSRAGFAAACTLSVNGRVVPATLREWSLFSEVGPISPGEIEVVLRTPELKGAAGDARRVGLALRTTNPAIPPVAPADVQAAVSAPGR